MDSLNVPLGSSRLRIRFLEAVESEKANHLADVVPAGPWVRAPTDYLQTQYTRLPFRCKASRREPTSWSADAPNGDPETTVGSAFGYYEWSRAGK